MNQSVTFTMTPGGEVERKIAARLYMRALGPWRRALIPLSFLLPLFGLMTLMGLLTGLPMWGSVGLIMVFIVYVAALSYLFCMNRLAQWAVAQIESSPASNAPFQIALSDAGIDQRGSHQDWDMVQSVTVLLGCTVLVLNWRLFWVLPDAVVAEVLPPEELRARIDAWRNAA